MNTVLYLTDTLAVWVCFDRDIAVNVHAETLHVENTPYQPCSWLQKTSSIRKHSRLVLILDSCTADIEAYPLNRIGSFSRDRSNCRALRKRLVANYPDAIVSTPRKVSKLDALLVQHTNLSDAQHQWLQWMQSSNLFINTVVSSTEILADLFTAAEGSYVVVSHILGSYRHTFCRGGHALFTRSVDEQSDIGLKEGLVDTIAHLKSTQLLETELSVYLIGCSRTAAEQLANLDGVLNVTCFEAADKFAKRPAVVVDEDLIQYNAVIQIAKHAFNRYSTSVGGGHRHVSLYMEKHAQLNLRKRNRRQWQALMVVCLLSLTYTVSITRDERDQTRQASEYRSQLSQEINALQIQMDGLSEFSVPLSKALMDTLYIQAAVGVGPGVLLTMLGELLTNHQELVLDELVWSTFDMADGGEFSTESYQLMGEHSRRKKTPIENAPRNVLMVSLAGRSMSKNGLRAKQDAVNALINDLQAMAGISHVSLVESPLRPAVAQSLVDTTETVSVFRVQFRVEHTDVNEA